MAPPPEKKTIKRMIRKTSRKTQPTDMKHHTINITELTNKKDISDTLAETFS